MKKFYIDDLFEIAECMYDTVVDNGRDVTFIGLYSDAAAVVRELLTFEDVELYDVRIAPEVINGYKGEYYVSLDSEFNIWCYPALADDGVIISESAFIVLISDDCNKAILREVEHDFAFEVSYNPKIHFPTDCDCSSKCDKCNCVDDECSSLNVDTYESTHISRTKDGKLAGFTKSWSDTYEDGTTWYSSFSHYGSNEESVKKIAHNFGVKLD